MVFVLFLGCTLTGCDPKDPLTPEERTWLQEHDGKIIVNNESGWPPIIYNDKDGNAFGIVMDYQRLLEKKLNFRFKMDKPDSWANFMERFKKGTIHVNNNLQKNPERTEYALFTKPYIEIPNSNSLSNLIVSPLNFTYEAWIYPTALPLFSHSFSPKKLAFRK